MGKQIKILVAFLFVGSALLVSSCGKQTGLVCEKDNCKVFYAKNLKGMVALVRKNINKELSNPTEKSEAEQEAAMKDILDGIKSRKSMKMGTERFRREFLRGNNMEKIENGYYVVFNSKMIPCGFSYAEFKIEKLPIKEVFETTSTINWVFPFENDDNAWMKMFGFQEELEEGLHDDEIVSAIVVDEEKSYGWLDYESVKE